MMIKKGQLAMEFLMTYGWAILASIIAIGVLAYFGVFSPSKFQLNQTVQENYTVNGVQYRLLLVPCDDKHNFTSGFVSGKTISFCSNFLPYYGLNQSDFDYKEWYVK